MMQCIKLFLVIYHNHITEYLIIKLKSKNTTAFFSKAFFTAFLTPYYIVYKVLNINLLYHCIN